LEGEIMINNCARIACLCAGLLFVAGSAWSADAPARAEGPDVVTLNFVNAEIEGVVKAVSEITRKNFLLDPRVKGTVNIISAKPIPRAQVYDVFLSALRLQGFTVIESRGILKIVPESDAKLNPSPTLGPDEKARAAGDTIRTQVFALKYESAVQIVPILRPLIAPNNTITAYSNNNTLVITDYASNLQRIEKIIESIDQPSGSDGIVLPLKYASALDVVQTVNRLFTEGTQAQPGGAADSSQRVIIVADTRSNTLLARSDNPSRLARLRSLVAVLDTPTSAAGNIHVVFLKNAEAVKIAETLRAIYQSGGGSAIQRPAAFPVTALGASLSAPAPGAAPPPGAPGAPSTQGQMAPPLAFSAQPQVAATASGIIQADAATNSIIITAPDAIYNDLRAAIEKLDSRRAQVYIEALVVEVTATKAAEFGIQWQDLSGAGATTTSPARAFGGTNFGGAGQNILGIAQNPLSAGPGLNVGVIKGVVNIPGINGQVLNLGLLVRALENDNNANILSTPTLLTTDNEEARIVVGQNVPFITGQYALSGASTTPTPFQTIVRQDVGIQLRIKPQISAGGTVRLQIYQEVSTVVDSTNPAGPITNKRSIDSMVLLDDGQIAVIGGLIQDNVSDVVNKIPLLGDLPMFGGLFQYKTRSRAKTNLMVFLRPTVLRDADQVKSLTTERYDYIRGEQANAKAKSAASPVLPTVESPMLPPLPPAGSVKPFKPE
jgi:general secretion pathway protein D